MTTRYATLLTVFALLIVAGCGGGSSTDPAPAPLNEAEKTLVGEYDLTCFDIYETGVCTHLPENFEAWGGVMTLESDRHATITMELCEHEGTPSATCDRSFSWRATAGVINLEPLDSGGDRVMMEWVASGMGQVCTEVTIPTNMDGYGLLLVDEGRENYDWERTD